MPPEVVLTGMGLVTALGEDPGECWERLVAGECGLRAGDPLLHPELRRFPVARVRASEADGRERKLDPFARLALRAARTSLEGAGLPAGARSGTAVVLGVGYGASTTHLASGRRVAEGRADRLSPHTLAASMPSAAAAQLSIELGLDGPALTLGTACASGLDALGLALDLVRWGRAERVLAGGVEAIADDLGVGGMAAARALAEVGPDGDPRVLRPFDQRRAGTAVGEGAALFLVESADAARRRGAPVLARLLGRGSRTDAHHITAPDPEGRGAEAAVREALQDARLEPSDVDAVLAHATGTPLNDSMEGRMLARVFPSNPPPILASKGQLGHTMGASGAVSVALAVLSLQHHLLPATVGCQDPDPTCAVRPLLETLAPHRLEHLLVEAFGFGGHDAALVLGRG